MNAQMYNCAHADAQQDHEQPVNAYYNQMFMLVWYYNGINKHQMENYSLLQRQAQYSVCFSCKIKSPAWVLYRQNEWHSLCFPLKWSFDPV